MQIIKISAGDSKYSNLLLRHTPEMKGVWGDCKFLVNTNVKKCDWWFVLHGSGLAEAEETICDPNHIVYVSMEPTEILSGVSEKFMAQFSHLIICDRNIIHPNITYMNWLTWWVGISVHNGKKHHFSKTINLNYDNFVDMKPIAKINKLSIIISDKNFSDGHKKRNLFLQSLIDSQVAKYLDIYGYGYTNISDKWNAIAQYKYHLVIENSSVKDYWSEKLADSFLGFTLPIYYGCPNILDYFSSDSIILIDIDNPQESINTIKKIIEGNIYEDKIDAVNTARNRIINDYNIFNLMANFSSKKASSFQNVKLRTNYFFSDSWPKKIVRYILKMLKFNF